VDGLDYRDGPDAKQPLLHFDAARVLVSRLDVPGKVVAIDEISLSGLETHAELGSNGSMSVLGMNVSPAAEPPRAAEVAAAPATQPAGTPAAGPATAPGPGQTDVAQILAARKQTLPLVTLEKLDVQLREVSVTASAAAGAQPVALRDVRLRNTSRVELLGDDANNRPPVEIELSGQVDPLIQKFDVRAKASPFARTPTAEVSIAAAGISGQKLVRLMPELEKQLDGAPLRDGTFAAKFEGQAKVEQAGPAAAPDFSRPFELAFVLSDVALRNGGEDKLLLAGVQEVRGDAIRVNPASGEVIVRSLEVTRPAARVWRDADGIHVLGCVIKVPEASATQPTSQPEAFVAAASEPAKDNPPATGPAAPIARPASEVRIDKLVISGIDFRAEDRTFDPPVVLPLNGLEVEVRGLSNLAQFEERPIRFSVAAYADKVEMAGGRQAELFSEVAAAGNVALYPKPSGWARTSVSGFELLPLTGVAKAQGVDLGGGVFDSSVDVRFEDDGALDTKSRFMFTDMKLSEPPDGPIRKALKLPTPLDAVLLVLQDQNGTITVPLGVAVKQGEVSGIGGAAVGALGSIVATAIASSPLKVTGGIASALGMKKEDQPKGPQVAAEVAFAPGAVEVNGLDAAVGDLIERLRREPKLEVTLRHELGGGDVVRAAERSNPPPDEVAWLAQRLRDRKAELIDARRHVAGQARVVLATAPLGESSRRTIEQLRAVDRDIAATEDALDRLYDLLRPGADRQAGRRTRAASLELADARLDAVKQAIFTSGIPGVEQRVRVTSARVTETPPGDAGGGRVVCAVLEKK
jgi:hypothetical protein